MTFLPSLLGALMAVLQAHPLCKRVTDIETKEFASDHFFFKVRAEFTGGSNFQVRIYYKRGYVDYAYQLFVDAPLLRWDNKEEFRRLATYPHHHHDEQGDVHPSPLAGEPISDIEIVLQAISKHLSQDRSEP